MDVSREIQPTLGGVFISDELKLRIPKKHDYFKEKAALQELATRMAYEPEAVLPKFVDLAMELTGGVSAGLSIYEDTPAPGAFRWRYLHGLMARFDGATTAPNFSPSAVTLDINAPVLSSHPERIYQWLADANIILPEVLLVPLYAGGKTPVGTLWIISDEEGHFDMGHARTATDLASFVGIALAMAESKRLLQTALDEQRIVVTEMNHRVMNSFAVTQSLLRMTANSAGTVQEMAQALSGRLAALADANCLIQSDVSGSGVVRKSVRLAAILETVLRPHQPSAGGSVRFCVEGPAIACGDHGTTAMALVFNELATNALKYGAWLADSGFVDVAWHIDGENLTVRWMERGGPNVAPPQTKGFGSRLADTMIVKQLRGALKWDWLPSGLAVTIVVPVKSLER